jgi:hypothetical protein
MARKDDIRSTTRPTSDRDLVHDALDKFEEAEQRHSELRRKAISDYRFAMIPGHQWDEHLTKKRRNRPCYEFNRIRQMIRRVTGEQLQNRPQIKLRPVEDTDRTLAEIYQGLIRNIEAISHAKIAYDYGFTWAVTAGRGAWEIKIEYENESGFDKCLKIAPIIDPFSVVFDPASRDFFRRDARYAFHSTLIPREKFKELYPGREIVDFGPALSGADSYWWYQDEVRIARYWWKEPKRKTIYLLSTGAVVDAVEFDPVAREAARQGITIMQVRDVTVDVVKCCLISGRERLSEIVEWPGKHFPIVINWGEYHIVDGKEYFCGMTRYGRDAQMIHNFELSTLVEVVAKMPNSPLTATPKMIEGLQSYYERLGYDDPPVLLYNPDPAAPQARPTREPAAQFPAAFANLSALSIDELKATTGIYDASLGARSNETSGRAIIARQREGDTSNYVFIDNHMKALVYTGELLVDLIPKVYDSTRTIRVLGEDGAEKFYQVNVPVIDDETGREVILNDLSRGKFDVTVTAGKSFETQRLEVAEAAEALATSPGPIGELAKYLLIRNLDVPGMDEFETAVRRILISQGLLEPGENDPPPPEPPPPNPKDVADAMLRAAQADKTAAEAERIRATTPADIERTQAQTAESISRVVGGLTPFTPPMGETSNIEP